jgi:hypothetical protein
MSLPLCLFGPGGDFTTAWPADADAGSDVVDAGFIAPAAETVGAGRPGRPGRDGTTTRFDAFDGSTLPLGGSRPLIAEFY